MNKHDKQCLNPLQWRSVKLFGFLRIIFERQGSEKGTFLFLLSLAATNLVLPAFWYSVGSITFTTKGTIYLEYGWLISCVMPSYLVNRLLQGKETIVILEFGWTLSLIYPTGPAFYCIKLWPKVLRMTQILIFKVCCLSLYDGNLHILQNVMKIRWIAINCKVPLCHANELNPPKTFPLHFSPATKGPADIMSVILSLTQVWVLTRTRLEITLSCWLSSNNRLEASKGG